MLSPSPHTGRSKLFKYFANFSQWWCCSSSAKLYFSFLYSSDPMLATVSDDCSLAVLNSELQERWVFALDPKIYRSSWTILKRLIGHSSAVGWEIGDTRTLPKVWAGATVALTPSRQWAGIILCFITLWVQLPKLPTPPLRPNTWSHTLEEHDRHSRYTHPYLSGVHLKSLKRVCQRGKMDWCA